MGLRNLFSAPRLSRELAEQRLRTDEAEARIENLTQQLAHANAEKEHLAAENSKLQALLAAASKESAHLKSRLNQSLIEERQLIEIEQKVEEMEALRLRYDKKISRLKDRLADYEKALKRYINHCDDELGAIDFLHPHDPDKAPQLLRPEAPPTAQKVSDPVKSLPAESNAVTFEPLPPDDDWFTPLDV